MRARDHGLVIGGGIPGTSNAITDVAGVRVGHVTLIEGDGPLRVGDGPVRTGVTVVVPPGTLAEPLFAGAHRLNGNGELTGLEWIRESGLLTSPIGLTNTHSVGVVRDALVAHEVAARGTEAGDFWALPVVGETWDGLLNDINGFHVTAEHVQQAPGPRPTGRWPRARSAAAPGMICHGFKGGIGTASRVVPHPSAAATPWACSCRPTTDAASACRSPARPSGGRSGPTRSRFPRPRPPARGAGSIIIVVATDAPLLPHQCRRLAQRAGFGVARTGGVGEHTSGDLFLCFATGNRDLGRASSISDTRSPLR